MGKLHQILTESSAHNMIMAGYYCFTFLLSINFAFYVHDGMANNVDPDQTASSGAV